jgi:hypothetical protein
MSNQNRHVRRRPTMQSARRTEQDIRVHVVLIRADACPKIYHCVEEVVLPEGVAAVGDVE